MIPSLENGTYIFFPPNERGNLSRWLHLNNVQIVREEAFLYGRPLLCAGAARIVYIQFIIGSFEFA